MRKGTATRNASYEETESSLDDADDGSNKYNEQNGVQEVLDDKSYRSDDEEDNVPVLALLTKKEALSPDVVISSSKRHKRALYMVQDAKNRSRRKPMDHIGDKSLPDVTTGKFMYRMLN